jgi:hypothetical protein
LPMLPLAITTPTGLGVIDIGVLTTLVRGEEPPAVVGLGAGLPSWGVAVAVAVTVAVAVAVAVDVAVRGQL